LDEEETRFHFAGTKPVARAGPLELVRIARPYRATWMTRGTTPDGWTRPARPTQIRVFSGASPGRHQIVATLSSSDAGRAPQAFTIRGDRTLRRRRLAPGTSVRVKLAACARKGTYGVATLAVGSSVQLPDGRAVGLHLARIDVRPTGRTCT